MWISSLCVSSGKNVSNIENIKFILISIVIGYCVYENSIVMRSFVC